MFAGTLLLPCFSRQGKYGVGGLVTYPGWLAGNRAGGRIQPISQDFLQNSLEQSCKIFLVFPLTPCRLVPTNNDLHKALK